MVQLICCNIWYATPIACPSSTFFSSPSPIAKSHFAGRDSAHQNEQKLLTLSLDEFLRRFLLHILPKGFVRIRNFGFLANRNRITLLPLCFQLLGPVAPPQTEADTSRVPPASPLWLCPRCGGPMTVIERLTAAQLQLRSPPCLAGAAA